MSRGFASVVAGFATLCLGLMTASTMALGLPMTIDLAFGITISREQLGIVELVMLGTTVFLTSALVTDGVITGLRGRRGTFGEGQLTERDEDAWLERLIDVERAPGAAVRRPRG